MIVAAVQLHPGPDVQANLETAITLIRKAAGRGAELVALPEMFLTDPTAGSQAEGSVTIPGRVVTELGTLSKELSMHLLAGSLMERTSGSEKFHNTSLLFDPSGNLIARYRKIHLFDAQLEGGRIVADESEHIIAGDAVADVIPTGGFSLGMAICYDLRFPGLFAALRRRGADVLAIPSAFRLSTGKDHWEILLRARAIENQAYVIAPGICGWYSQGRERYGRSMIIDPWGVVMANAGDDVGVVYAELQRSRLDSIRGRMAIGVQEQPNLY